MRVLFIFLFLATLTNAQVMQKNDSCIYIASYNIYTFGSNSDNQSWNAARVLASGSFDLVAIQEVMGDQGQKSIELLVKHLKDSFDLNYQYLVSKDIGDGYGGKERIAFIYKPDKVKHRKYKGNEIQIIDVPEGRDFVYTRWKSNKVTFVLGSGHLYYGKDGTPSEKEATLKQRTAELNQVLGNFKNSKKQFGDEDLIFLGDFNRAALVPDYKSITYDTSLYFIPNVEFFDPKLNEVPEVKPKHIENKGVPNNDPQLVSTTVGNNTFVYDMVFCSKSLLNNYQAQRANGSFNYNFGVISFDETNGIGYVEDVKDYTTHNALKAAFSDHRPVWIRLNTKIK